MDKLELIKYDEDKILNRSSSFEDDAIQDVRQEGAGNNRRCCDGWYGRYNYSLYKRTSERYR